MRAGVVLGVIVSALVPSVARADCWSPQCVISQRLGAGRLDPHIASIVGAGAATMIAVAVAMDLARREERPMPDGVVEVAGSDGKKHRVLQLIPAAPSLPVTPEGYETVARPDGAFRFNDTAANVAIAVGGAAILTSIVVGMLSKH